MLTGYGTTTKEVTKSPALHGMKEELVPLMGASKVTDI